MSGEFLEACRRLGLHRSGRDEKVYLKLELFNKALNNCEEIFAPNGVLAQHIPGFKHRAAQVELTQAVADAITQKRHLIAEAGTGTGKTFAYLIPAFLSGLKVIIATGTKNLQDQLFHRDLPLIKQALGLSLKTMLLKGRANYLCHYRIKLHAEEGRFLNKDVLQDFQYIHSNLARSETGDINEFANISEDSEVWSYVTSTGDNCLGNECPNYAECFLVKARKNAQQADVLVINHHLYFADLLLKEDGFGEILPGAQLFIFDEAHQLPDVATNFFGVRLSSRQLLELSKDCRLETMLTAPDMHALIDNALLLESKVIELRLALGEKAQRRPWLEVANDERLEKAREQLQTSLTDLIQLLTIARVRSKGLDACYTRTKELSQLLERTTISSADTANQILWFETFNQAFSLHGSPLSIAEDFSQALNGAAQYIFTSATLAVDKKFDHFADALGLKEYNQVLMQSPFSYKQQALLYLPRGLPDSSHPEFIQLLIDKVLPVINHLGGKTFLLFTSHKALQQAAELLKNKLQFPLLIQGSKAKNALLEQFRQLGNAVLLGTSSFWEGVDVKGSSLSCVIIDKLPFESPQDPIVNARLKQMRQQQQDPFNHYQLPKAIIALKQGVGRLIRDENDQGILMIADPRLGTRAYGAQFFASLPVIPKTRNLENVLNFITNMRDFDIQP